MARAGSWWTLTGRLALGAAALGLAVACGQHDPAPAEVPGQGQPAGFPAAVYVPAAGNEPSRAGFELGRALFYDRRLSADSTVSCGSCHQSFAAFAHVGHRVSHGVGGLPGLRNAPALQNLRWRQSFMADGGVLHLSAQPLTPLADSVEMHLPLPEALTRLNANTGYRARFAAVYGPGPIDTRQLLAALVQFTSALTSSSSRYDHYVRHEAGGELAAGELRGLATFRAKCAGCHAGELFSDDSFRNNGLDSSFGRDAGRAHITKIATDLGRFRVPSLRNVARTAPYMHDGRLDALTDVLAHYDHGVVDSPTLDPLLRQPGGQLGIALSSQEQSDLLAFLNTLTDNDFITDKQLAAPPP